VNNFVGERLQIACDAVIDISQAVTESFQPLDKHVPDLIPRFVGGQKQLFEKRMNARAHLLNHSNEDQNWKTKGVNRI
jgi:hypothetical protein